MEEKEIHLTQEQIDRFWSKVDIRGNDDCWIWKAGIAEDGYGQYTVRQNGYPRPYRAHRVAFVLSNSRQINPNMVVAHAPVICHNPLCCNPNHLRETTPGGNADDRSIDGTNRFGDENGVRKHPESLARGEQVITAKLKESDIVEIHHLWKSGVSMNEIGKLKNVGTSHVWNILRRKSWAHVKLEGE